MKPFPADRTATSEPEVAVHLSRRTARTTLRLVSLLLSVFVFQAWSGTAAGTITVSITPSNATVSSGGTQQFSAMLQGTANTGVKWSTSAGTISNAGLFTAPKVSATTAVSITVTSVADSSKSALATVAVVTPGQVSGASSHADAQNFIMNAEPQVNIMPPQQENFDGPAELPRVYIDSSMSNTPSPGKTWTVGAGKSLQDALNNASCGDTISLEAGAVFSEKVTVPANNCDDAHWITVRTSAADSSLPAEGTRISPCYAGVKSLPGRPVYKCTNPQNVMAKILMTRTGAGPIVFAPGANHYRLLGLEVTRTANSPIVNALISMTPGFTADHLVVDRVWLHGTAHDETTKGIQLGGSTQVALVDSYLSDFHCTSHTGACTDSAAVGGGIGNNPMGPYKIVNNFLEAAGENILLGGAASTLSPADIEIRSNHMFKPLTWMKGQPGYVGGKGGYPFIVKNLFELKNAQRVLLEGNVMENTWGGFSQAGYGILLTPKNHKDACPSCQVTDVTIRYSTISHVGSGMQIANGLSDSGGAPLAGERYSIHDIVIDDINSKLYNGYGNLAQLSMGKGDVPILKDVSLQHITGFPKDVLLNVGDKTSNKMGNFIFLNNMVTGTERPLTSTGGGTDNCAYHAKPLTVLSNCFVSYQFASNAMIAIPDLPTDWPNENYFPGSPKGIFVNYNGGNGGDYHIVAGSPYKNAGTDGKDLGADIDLVLQYTATAR